MEVNPEVNPPLCRLRDLGSLNGTFVNGVRVREADLAEGDTIRVGQTMLKVHVEPPEPEVPPDDGSGEDTIPVRCLRCGLAGVEGQVPAGRPGVEGMFVCDPCQEQMQQAGETVPGYRLIRQLRDGGMGVVWLADEVRTGRPVAVKLIKPELTSDRRTVQMLLRGSNIWFSLRHPHIAEFITAGQYHGQLFIVTEYVDGQDAERLCQQQGGRLPAGEVVSLGLQVLEALDFAHQRQVVHRDIKPSNILVRGASPHYQVKMIDFDLARYFPALVTSGITQREEVRGSIPYMPAEQVLNCRGVDHRADLFSLGATLYHLLTGQFVYDFRPGEKEPLLTIVDGDIIPLERRGVPVPRALAEVIHRALRKDPAERYQSAREMSEALERM
jgi:serine/threonine-protein kinase